MDSPCGKYGGCGGQPGCDCAFDIKLCVTCGVKYAERDRDECFRCRIRGVSFNFVGGGGYGREAFQRTNHEFMNENYGFDHADRIRSDELAKKD